MREADDNVIKRCDIFVDSRPGATKKTGDITIPLESGVITLDDLNADLFELCSGAHKGRENDQKITLFKSVGHALEDLAAAKLVAHFYSECRDADLILTNMGGEYQLYTADIL
jgi:alanine dehydrogenase